MKTLWKAGKNFDLDTMALEEKILIMLAFERTDMEETEPIFESYRRKYGKKMLLAAYLNLMSYQYFVKEMDVQKPVFDEIERRMKHPNPLIRHADWLTLGTVPNVGKLPKSS